jgi:hypothetical protein
MALVSLTICVTHFLLIIGMQKRLSISMRSIFQNNLRITTHNSLSCLPTGIHHNLCIVARNFLSCPSTGILRNLRIVAHNSLSYPPVGIRRTLVLKSNNMPFPSKMVLADMWVLQKGLLFLFVHWFNEGCCVERGEIGEEVRSV